MKLMKKLLLVILLAATPVQAQSINLKLDGDGVKVVKVDKVIVVKEDRTVVDSFPFTVAADPGAGLYFWTFPVGVQAADQGDKIQVTSAPKGSLTISVKLISADLDKDGKFKGFVTRFGSVTFDVGGVTPPVPPPVPPDPKPPDPPKPPEPPAPIPLSGLRALIVYETSDIMNMPAQQALIITSTELQLYMNGKGAKDSDGKTAAFRKLDKDTPLAATEQQWVKDAMKRPRQPGPWIIVSNGATGFEGPLPPTIGETLLLLRKYGG